MNKTELAKLEKIFNPYDEPVKQGELTDVDAHWEHLCQSYRREITKSASNEYETDTAPTDLQERR